MILHDSLLQYAIVPHSIPTSSAWLQNRVLQGAMTLSKQLEPSGVMLMPLAMP